MGTVTPSPISGSLGTDEPCPPIDQGADFVLSTPGVGALICLLQPDTGMTRTVVVSTGGRVQTQQ